MIVNMFSPGHRVKHLSVCVAFPMQYKPSYCGSGLVHSLALLLAPSKHDTEQGP